MTLPRIFDGKRRRLFLRLALNGVCQAAAAIAASLLLSRGLTDSASVGAMPLYVVAGLMAAGLVILALRTLERAQAERLGQLYINTCRLRLFGALSDLPLRGGPKVRYGIMMTRMITDLTSMKNWVARGVAKLTVASISLAGAMAALTIVNPGLAMVSAAMLAVLLLAGLGASFILRSRVRRARRLRGRLSGNVGEIARARGLPRHFGRLRVERQRLKRQGADLCEALVSRSFVSGLMRSLSDMMMPMTLGAAALAAGSMALMADLTIGALAAGLFLIGFVAGPLRDVMLALEYRENFIIGREKLEEVFAQLPDRPQSVKPAPAGRRTGPAALVLRGADVPGAGEALDASLIAGERVLLTGASGAGKTTLLGAVAGLGALERDGLSGLALDGRDFAETPLEDWHARVTLVSEDLPLLKGSLSRNVRYGNRSLGERDVRKTLHLCGVKLDRRHFPAGLKTRLEEGARNLPASLCSRIALARAVAAGPGLLLVDDANFLTDGDCRAALRRVVAETGMSAIVAAARVSDVLTWDQVWRLREGRLTPLRDINGRHGAESSPIRERA